MKRDVLFLLFALMMSVAGVYAQTGQTPTDDNSVDKLQLQVNALLTMNQTLGNVLQQAQLRQEQMQTFANANKIKVTGSEKVSTSDAPKLSKVEQLTTMSFDRALAIAVQHEQMKGPVHPTTRDPGTLRRQVSANRTLCRESWDRLQPVLNQVERLAGAIQQADQWSQYKQWAAQQVAAQAETEKRQAETRRKAYEQQQQMNRDAALTYYRKQDAKIQQQHQQALQQTWQHQEFLIRQSTQRYIARHQQPHINTWGPYDDVWHEHHWVNRNDPNAYRNGNPPAHGRVRPNTPGMEKVTASPKSSD